MQACACTVFNISKRTAENRAANIIRHSQVAQLDHVHSPLHSQIPKAFHGQILIYGQFNTQQYALLNYRMVSPHNRSHKVRREGVGGIKVPRTSHHLISQYNEGRSRSSAELIANLFRPCRGMADIPFMHRKCVGRDSMVHGCDLLLEGPWIKCGYCVGSSSLPAPEIARSAT